MAGKISEEIIEGTREDIKGGLFDNEAPVLLYDEDRISQGELPFTLLPFYIKEAIESSSSPFSLSTPQDKEIMDHFIRAVLPELMHFLEAIRIGGRDSQGRKASSAELARIAEIQGEILAVSIARTREFLEKHSLTELSDHFNSECGILRGLDQRTKIKSIREKGKYRQLYSRVATETGGSLVIHTAAGINLSRNSPKDEEQFIPSRSEPQHLQQSKLKAFEDYYYADILQALLLCPTDNYVLPFIGSGIFLHRISRASQAQYKKAILKAIIRAAYDFAQNYPARTTDPSIHFC